MLVMKEMNDHIYDEKLAELFPLVKSIALKYASNTQPLDDLIQEGLIGVIKAVDNYDDSNQAKFSTYAVYWIRKYILDFIAKNNDGPMTEYWENKHDIEVEANSSKEDIMIEFPDNFPFLEKEVIIKLYQYEFTLSEVAKQLKLPRERIRQIREKALRRLKAIGFTLD